MKTLTSNKAFWLLLVICVVTILPFLGLSEYHTKGEPREAIVSYSMLDSGNWILPRNNGGEMAYKPPFFHWSIAAVSAVVNGGQVTEMTSRLPSAIALIAMTLCGFLFFAKRKGVQLALLAAFITLTNFELHRAGANCRVDMVLTALTVGALYCLYRWYEKGLKGIPWLAILLMSCGTLTKGPVGTIIPCLVVGIPPVIMSVFLGQQLDSILDEIEQKVSSKKMSPDEKTELKLNVGKIPEIMRDNTDRNRTSPFAFTGNRFEFRAVGASANCGAAMIVLNTAVAEQLIAFKKEADALIDRGVKKDEAIFQVLRKYIIACKKIRFEGNGYSKEWQEEAQRRGLSVDSDCVGALKAYLAPKARKLFVENGIFTERELEARFEIKNEIYLKKLQIESRVLGDLALNHIIPTAITYQNTLIENVKGLKEILPDVYNEVGEVQLKAIKEISTHIKEIRTLVDEMTEARKVANNSISNEVERAQVYSATVLPYLDKIRYHIDKLELLVDDEIWPLPKYRELLFFK